MPSAARIMDLATVDGLWQLSDTPVYVADGSEFDRMTVQSITDDAISMANQGKEITLGRNRDISIMPGMSIRTADADESEILHLQGDH